MVGYATKVKREIARWLEAGLIDEATARRLAGDIDRNGGGAGVSFGTVLAMMAAALFAAAILIFIAANWELIPRLVRVGLLFGIIVAGYVGGAFLKLRGHAAYAEATWVVAAAAFGAAIALVAQMYHLSGDEAQAILTWGAGAALAAAALRSGPLTIGAVLLGVVWMMMVSLGGYADAEPPVAYLLVAGGLWALSFWTGSPPARHLVLLSLFLFVVFLQWEDESLNVPILLALLSAGLFAFGHLRPDLARRFAALGPGLPAQALVGFLTGVGLVQVNLSDDPEFLIASIAAFAGIVAALLLAGRDNAVLRWLAYAAFIFQLGFVYVVMLGTMLGTAGFFVLGGLALSVLAWLITRLERRFAGGPADEGAIS